jgi:aryl-alcohol dehydrogenase-like predicted oxidoreductase
MEKMFFASLENLAVEKVYGILVHNAQDLLGSDGKSVWRCLESFCHRGLVEKIGVSVYDEVELRRIVELFPLRIAQVPLSILDQRLLQSGILKELKDAHVEIHGRSCFLQGLLLMSPEELPSHFESIRKTVQNLRVLQKIHGLTPVGAALGFVLGVAEIDTVLVGVNTPEQFREILSEARTLSPALFSEFSVADTNIVEPRHW